MQALNAVGLVLSQNMFQDQDWSECPDLVENLFLYFPASVPWENMILYTPTMGDKVVLLG